MNSFPFAALGNMPKDYARGCGLLTIAHSIFKRYRHEFKSDALYGEIKYVLEQLQVHRRRREGWASREVRAWRGAGELNQACSRNCRCS